MVCGICGEELESGVPFFGKTVHENCKTMAYSYSTALEYARAYPKDFFDNLEELLTCTDHPEETKAVHALLIDFRDRWGGEKPFPAWIADN